MAEHGIPELHARKQMRQAAETDLSQWNAYGPLFQSLSMTNVKGKEVPVEAVNFFSFLHAAYKAGGCFSEWVDKGQAKQPCSFQFSVEPFALHRRTPPRQCLKSQRCQEDPNGVCLVSGNGTKRLESCRWLVANFCMSQQCGEHVRWEYVASFSRNSQKYFLFHTCVARWRRLTSVF